MEYELILVPTENDSHLSIHKGKLMCGKIEYINNKTWENQILIAISDEPIKVGDCLNIDGLIGKAIEIFDNTIEVELGWTTTQLKVKSDCKKIICSTDKSLTPNSWIDISKWLWILDIYNQDKKLPKVEFEMIHRMATSMGKTGLNRHGWDCIITNPDGSVNIVEPKKTIIFIDEFSENIIEKMKKREETIKSVTNCPTCNSEVNVVGNGTTHAYVPKDKMYSREEVENLIIKFSKKFNLSCEWRDKITSDFIKENLK